MNWIKKNIPIILLLFISLFLGINSISMYKQLNDRDNNIKDLKTRILVKDSVYKNKEGIYVKLVDDTKKSQKELKKILDSVNSDFSKKLGKLNSDIVALSRIKVKPEDIQNKPEIEKSGDTINVKSYYPNKDSYFIKNEVNILGDSTKVEWTFKNFNLDIAVVEKSPNLFEAQIDAPDWLVINDVQVNTLPFEVPKKDNFDFLLGTNLGYNYDSKNFNLGLEAGIRINKTIISLNSNTNKDVGLSLKKLF